MDRFSKFHPLISFSFFVGVITATIIFTNSFTVVISFICAFLYSLKLKGINAVKTAVKFVLPIVIFAALFNMLFSHYGKITLFSVKEINFTAEAFLAGLFAGIMTGAVIMWFMCYNEIVTSNKVLYLFGGIAPNIALLFSMVLNFIPLMAKTANEIKEAHIGLGLEIKGVKNAVSRFSALLSICLEKSIETADSMKARGFGKGKRKIYSPFKLRASDAFTALPMIAMLIYIFVSGFNCYPQISFSSGIYIKSVNYASLYVFGLFALIPLAVDLWEDFKWLMLKSKI